MLKRLNHDHLHSALVRQLDYPGAVYWSFYPRGERKVAMTVLEDLETILHRLLKDQSDQLLQHSDIEGFRKYMQGKREATLVILEYMHILQGRY